MSLAEMRKELRELKKAHERPVSRLKKADVSAELERLRHHREVTPAAAAVPSAPPKSVKSKVESVKEAKKHEFPVAPADVPKKAAKAPKVTGGKVKDVVADKVKMSKAKLLAMIQGMDSDAE
jgi:hypothetical protein